MSVATDECGLCGARVGSFFDLREHKCEVEFLRLREIIQAQADEILRLIGELDGLSGKEKR